MKKLLILLTTFYSLTGYTQLYVGVDAGAKWSYNSLSGDKSNVKSNPDLKPRGGVKLGYNLSEKIQMETGLFYNPFSVAFQFNDPSARFTHIALSTMQVPIRIKPVVYDNDLFKVYAVAGVVPTFITSRQSSLPWDSAIVADGTGDTLTLTSTANYNLKNSFIAVELGISLDYQLNDKVTFTANLIAQTSFSDIMHTDLEYTINGGTPVNSRLTSKGLNTYFEAGVAYYLGD